VAGSLFVLPSAVLLWILSYIYAAHGQVLWIAAIFYGLKPAVVAIVAHAVIRIGKRALKNEVMWAIAALAFVAIFFLKVPFPAIILGAGLIGLLGGMYSPRKFVVIKPHGAMAAEPAAVLDDSSVPGLHARPTIGRNLTVCAVCLVLWAAPLAAVAVWQGASGVLFTEGIFFSKAALVTFGGAYAVLPYVAQQAVERYSWLSTSQMLDGLGLAESTPGPLIMVVQFVGFIAAWNHPGDLPPLLAATLGAAITTWVTFVPCFLWIFLGAPYIESLRANQRLSAALSAVTAAVVGVVLNLAVWFAINLFAAGGAIDWFAVAICLVALLALIQWKLDVLLVVLFGAVSGLLYRTLGG
jgi:chromate transporter